MLSDTIIVMIHGANATPLTFSYIASNLPGIEVHTPVHNCSRTFFQNIKRMARHLPKDKPVYLVGHSLGGLYAVHMSKYLNNVVGGCTISTPYAGVKGSDYAKWLAPTYSIFRETSTYSGIVKEAATMDLPGDWINIVSTAGHLAWHGSNNDGLLEISSMSARKDITEHRVTANHYEVVLHDQTATHLRNHFLELTE